MLVNSKPASKVLTFWGNGELDSPKGRKLCHACCSKTAKSYSALLLIKARAFATLTGQVILWHEYEINLLHTDNLRPKNPLKTQKPLQIDKCVNLNILNIKLLNTSWNIRFREGMSTTSSLYLLFANMWTWFWMYMCLYQGHWPVPFGESGALMLKTTN